VVAKHPELRYEPGRRAMVKVKVQHTAECVVAGFRYVAFTSELGSLLLGLYAADGTLRHMGVSSSFSRERRADLLRELTPLVVPLQGHPWQHGFELGRSPVGRLPMAGTCSPCR
jgi:ATP-dependent DNA ligase